jgi:ABC-type multidrug transport system fused ATPase/permease subunit
MIYDLRIRLIEHLSTLSADYYDHNPPGDLMFRLEQDVEYIASFGAEMVTTATYTLVAACSSLVILFSLNARLTAVVVPLVPVFFFVRRRCRAGLKRSADLLLSSSAARMASLEQYLASITHLQLLQGENYATARYARRASEVKRALIDRRKVEFKASFIPFICLIAGVSGAIYYGGYLTIAKALSLGGFVAFFSYLVRLVDPLVSVIDTDTRVLWAKASIERILQVFNTTPTVRESCSAVTINSARRELVEIRDLSFGYHPGRNLLKHINCTLQPGERIALTGASGCGKSTLAKLLLRLYDPSNGAVFISGIDVRDVALRSLRSISTLVPPNPILFEGTILDNLLCGSQSISFEECEEVIGALRLEKLITRLPKQWYEEVGSCGIGLSGGERQRLGIARAILRRPQILVLDECTAGLDVETERQVLSALDSHLRGAITLLISHRPTVMDWADRVVVMSDGEITNVR